MGDGLSPGAVPGFVAFLAPGPVPAALLADRAVPMAKYYPPLSETPVARDLYDRNVCIACHPGMASLADDRIAEEIRRIAGIAGEQVGIRTA